jgi:hypothetical protein
VYSFWLLSKKVCTILRENMAVERILAELALFNEFLFFPAAAAAAESEMKKSERR